MATEAVDPALKGLSAGAATGNPAVGLAVGGLSFMQAQQERKRLEQQQQYEAKKYGATTSAELLNSALDRYMKAVS